MSTTEREIDSFARFAKERLARGETGLSIDELFDEWRLAHPPADDARAIEASLRDMQAEESGRPFDEFAAEFRRENGMPPIAC